MLVIKGGDREAGPASLLLSDLDIGNYNYMVFRTSSHTICEYSRSCDGQLCHCQSATCDNRQAFTVTVSAVICEGQLGASPPTVTLSSILSP